MAFPVIPAIMAGSAIVSALGGIFGRNKNDPKNQIQPQVIPPMFPGAGDSFINWLMSGFQQKDDGGWQLNNLPSYPGQLNVDPGQTMLPAIWEQYGQGNPGLWGPGSLSELTARGVQNPYAGIMDQIYRWGAPAGNPLTNIESMISYGGTGGPGHQALVQTLAHGRPYNSPGSEWMQNLAQYGIASQQSGMPMHLMAYGQPSPASNFLAPFATVPTYQSPRVA